MLGIDNIERVKPGGLELKDRLVAVNRVTKVTKGGRTFSFFCYCSSWRREWSNWVWFRKI